MYLKMWNKLKMLIRCGIKWLIVLKEWLQMYLENLRDVGDRLRKLGGGIQRSKQPLNQRERAIEDYLNVETMLRMKVIKQPRRRQERLSKRLNVRLMITYTTNWVQRRDIIIFINFLKQEK